MKKSIYFYLASSAFVSILFRGVVFAYDQGVYTPIFSNKNLFTTLYKWDFSLFLIGLVLLLTSTIILVNSSFFRFLWLRKMTSYLNPIYFFVTLVIFLHPLFNKQTDTSVIISYSLSPSYELTTSEFPWFLIHLNSTWNLVLGVLLIILYFLLKKKSSNELEQI